MPDPIFTFHSAMRLLERGITRDHILAAVHHGKLIESDDGKDTYAKDRLRVVVVRSGKVIVTAFRVREKSVKRKIREARKASKKYRRLWG